MDTNSSREGTPRRSEYSRGTVAAGTHGTLGTSCVLTGYSKGYSLRSQRVLEYRGTREYSQVPEPRLGPVLEGYLSRTRVWGTREYALTHPNAGRRDRLGPLQGPLRAREADRRSGAAARARSGTPAYPTYSRVPVRTPEYPRVLPSTPDYPSARRAPGTFSSIRRKRPSRKADRPVSRASARQLALPRVSTRRQRGLSFRIYRSIWIHLYTICMYIYSYAHI
jgi:hypothetical protein